MTSPARQARLKAIDDGFTEIVARGRNFLLTRRPGTNRYSFDSQVGDRGWHFGSAPFTQDHEVDTAWEPSSGAWDWEVTKNDFQSYVRDSVPVSYRYVDAATGHYVELTVNNILWVNDEDQSEQAASFAQVAPAVDDDVIAWSDIAAGWHVAVRAERARLSKWVTIDSLAELGAPTIGGTNEHLRFEFVFQKSSGLEVWVDGVQWDEKNNTWVETGGDIEFRDETTQQPIFWFRQPMGHDSFADGAPSQPTMRQQVRRLGVNYYCETDTPWAWLQNAVYPVRLDATADSQVGAGGDDYVCEDNSDFYNNFAVIAIGCGTGNAPKDVGLRFTGMTFDGTINHAYVSFRAQADSATNNLDINITCVDADNPAASTSCAEMAGKSLTTALVFKQSWSNWTTGTWYMGEGETDAEDLKTLFQELVDTYTISNDAVIVRYDDNGSGNGNTKKGHSYDGSSSDAAKLHIDYTVAAGDSIPYLASRARRRQQHMIVR